MRFFVEEIIFYKLMKITYKDIRTEVRKILLKKAS